MDFRKSNGSVKGAVPSGLLSMLCQKTVTDYVPSSFQLFQGGADAVRALLADFG